MQNVIYIDGKFYKLESVQEQEDGSFLITAFSLCGKFKYQVIQN